MQMPEYKPNFIRRFRANGLHPLLFIAGVGLACVDVSASAQNTVKKLIELGYDAPDTSYLRDNINAMKLAEPMDGVVYTARPNTGTNQEFTWNSWGSPTVSRSSMQHAVNELQAANTNGYAENFLRFISSPGNVDWFDNYNDIVANGATAAWLSTEGKTRGLFLDLEDYTTPLWDYRSAKYKTTKTFAQYSAQARQRGQQMMTAMQAESPNLSLFLPVSYSYVWGPSQINGQISQLPNVEYGLLPSFLDGMLDVAGPGVKFIDGFENAYGYETAAQFQSARTRILSGTLPIVADDAKYAEKFRVGFAVWLDAFWRNSGWYSDPSQFALNYYTPQEFENVLRYALQASDEYVWIYSEQLFWRNSNTLGSPDIPQAYLDAARAAMNSVSPGWFRGSGDWNQSGNWRGGVPNGVNALALFAQEGSSNQTVYSNVPVTAGTLRFDGGNNYVLGGAGPLTMQTSSGTGSIDVIRGSQKINMPLFFASSTNIAVASGATLTVGNPATIRTNKAVSKTGTVIFQAALTLEAGATLTSVSGPMTFFGAPTLGSGAKIDLRSTTLAVDYHGLSNPSASLLNQLQTGYANGAWNGPGIDSASAVPGQLGLGWVDDQVLQQVTVKLTRYGDANLSGSVDSNDFNAFLTGYGASGGIWARGDFNYDGKVDTADFNLLAGNFGQMAPADLPLGSSVPEPACVVLLAAMGLMRRGASRRQRRDATVSFFYSADRRRLTGDSL